MLLVNIRYSEFVANCFSPHSSLDGVDHLIRLVLSEPPSFFITSRHPQTYTLTHEPWPSPPKVRNECFDVDICASSDRLLNLFASPFSCTPLIHGRQLLSFLTTNLMKERKRGTTFHTSGQISWLTVAAHLPFLRQKKYG